MARAYCNGKLIDIWDKEYQEKLVDYHGHEYQVMKAICELIKPTPIEAYGSIEAFLITK